MAALVCRIYLANRRPLFFSLAFPARATWGEMELIPGLWRTLANWLIWGDDAARSGERLQLPLASSWVLVCLPDAETTSLLQGSARHLRTVRHCCM